jgi:hypothetical protein
MEGLMKAWIIRTTKRSAPGLLIVLAFWAIAAKVFNAFILYPWLDMPTHFAGGLVIANFFRVAIQESASGLGKTPVVIRVVAVLGLTTLSAVCWEFAEFLSDQFLASHLNLGVQDTLSDLFFGTTGGLCVAMYEWFSASR